MTFPDGSLNRASSFPRTLIEDVIEAQKRLQRVDSAFNRRTFIRTVFAAVEGIISLIKADLLKAAQRSPGAFGIAEIALLREEAYFVDTRGRPKVRPNFISLAENVRFIVEIANRHPEIGYSIDFSHKGWSNLQNSLKVRHRLAHPKTRADLEVSIDEARKALSGFFWLLALAVEVTGLARDAVKKAATRLSEKRL